MSILWKLNVVPLPKVHKPNVTSVVPFIWCPLSSAGRVLSCCSLILRSDSQVSILQSALLHKKYKFFGWALSRANSGQLSGLQIVLTHCATLLTSVQMHSNRFLRVKNSVSFILEWHWPAQINGKMFLGLILIYLLSTGEWSLWCPQKAKLLVSKFGVFFSKWQLGDCAVVDAYGLNAYRCVLF